MEGQGDGGGKMEHGGRSGFGVLPALTGLPTSISCQRYSKMVARAASSLYRKKGQSAEDGAKEEEEGRGDAEEGEERGRAESTATPPPPPSSLFFSLLFASFPSVAWWWWWWWKPAQKTGKGKILRTWFIQQNADV